MSRAALPVAELARLLSDEHAAMVAKSLSEHAQKLDRLARSRRYSGLNYAEKRARLRRLSGKYSALAREFDARLRAGAGRELEAPDG